MKKQHLARAVAACAAPLLVVPFVATSDTGGASTTRSSSVLDNRFDTAGYDSDEVHPRNGVAEPLSGTGTFESGDKGYIGIDLLGPDPVNAPLPRTRSGDKVTTRFELPTELTLDRSPVPAGTVEQYDVNWCAPAADLRRDWIQAVTCTIDATELTVETTLARSLTRSDWREFTIRTGVEAGSALDRESADVESILELPTDNSSTPARQHSFTAKFKLPSNALGIHDLSLVSSRGSAAWWPKETGLMAFSVLPKGSTGPLDVREGESFRIQLEAHNPSRDDAGAGQPRRGGLEFRETTANTDNPCSNAGNAGWMPGWSISCSHPGQGDVAPESALEIVFTRTGPTETGHVLARSAFRIPVTNTYSSTTDDSVGDDSSSAAFTSDLQQQSTGPTRATSSTTLLRGNALGLQQLSISNGRGGEYISPGDRAYAEFRLTDEPGGVKGQVRTGDVYRVYFLYEESILLDAGRTGLDSNVCDSKSVIIPGFKNECRRHPDSGMGMEYVDVLFTRTGPDAEVTIPDTALRFPVKSNAWSLEYHSGDLGAYFSSTSDQPSLGESSHWITTNLLPLSLGLHSAAFEPDSANANPWPHQDRAWWRLRLTNPALDRTFLNVSTGDWFQVDIRTITPWVKVRPEEPGGVCADQTANGLWEGWTVTCTLSEGRTYTTLNVRFTRTGPDDTASVVPDDFLAVKLENVHAPGSDGGGVRSELRARFSSSLPSDRVTNPEDVYFYPVHE